MREVEVHEQNTAATPIVIIITFWSTQKNEGRVEQVRRPKAGLANCNLQECHIISKASPDDRICVYICRKWSTELN